MARLILLGMFVAIAMAIKHLPWYYLAGGVVALALGLKLFGGWLLLIPFRMKGAVLKQAAVRVHAIERADPLPRRVRRDEDGCVVDERRDCFLVDVTITPRTPNGNFKHWEPGELTLVKPGTKALDDDDSCCVNRLEVHNGTGFVEDEGFKFEGARRLRMHIGVKSGVNALAFQYYLESFGRVDLGRVGELVGAV